MIDASDTRVMAAQISALEDQVIELRGAVEYLTDALSCCHDIIEHMNPSAARMMKRLIECAEAAGEPVEEGAA